VDLRSAADESAARLGSCGGTTWPERASSPSAPNPSWERAKNTVSLGGLHKDFRLVKQHNHQRKCTIR
jgi:hypothetical protein